MSEEEQTAADAVADKDGGLVNYDAKNLHEIPGQHLPNLYINRFHILGGGQIRLTLGTEVLPGATPNYNVVGILSLGTARQMAEMIIQLCDLAEARVDA